MATRKQNFFKNWTFEELQVDCNQNLDSNVVKIEKEQNSIESVSSRRSRRAGPISKGTSAQNIKNSFTSKIQLTSLTDNTTFETGDCVLYQEKDSQIEAWYVYYIDMNEIDKKINVLGLRMIDWSILQEQYGIKPSDFAINENVNDSDLIFIPEIGMLSSDAWFKPLNISSLMENQHCHYRSDESKEKIDCTETRYVNYLFDTLNKQLKQVDFDFFKRECTGDSGAFERFKRLMNTSTVVPLSLASSSKINKSAGHPESNAKLESDAQFSKSGTLGVKNKRKETEEVFIEKNNNLKKLKSKPNPVDKTTRSRQVAKVDYKKLANGHKYDSFFDSDDNFANDSSDDSLILSSNEYTPDKNELEYEQSKSTDSVVEESASDREFGESYITRTRKKYERKNGNNNKETKLITPERETKLTTAASYANSYQKNHLNMRIKNNYEKGSRFPSDDMDCNLTKFKSQLSTNQSDFIAKVPKNPVGTHVPGREEEFTNIYSRVASFINSGVGSSLYISGVPGTGKSYTVKKSIEHLLQQNSRAFSFAEINGLKLINPDDCYDNLCDKLQINLKVKEKAVVALERYFSRKRENKVVLLLDEIDVLLSHDSEKLYNFFNWPYLENSNLFVIAIGNRMNLSEQLNSKTNSRLGTNNSIQFSPYGVAELESILQYRLSEASDASKMYIDKETGSVALFSSSNSINYIQNYKFKLKILKIVFPKTSIQFLAKSSSASSSDVRTAKGIGLSAMELLEQEYINSHGVIYNYEKTLLEEEGNDYEAEFEVEELKVTTAHISKAKGKSHSASIKEYVMAQPLVSKFILFAAIQISNEYQTNVLYFRNVIDKLDTYLEKYGHKPILNDLVSFMEMSSSNFSSNNIRIIDWDFAVNQLYGSGLIEITRLSNERANLFTLKNKDAIEEGLSSFISALK